MKFSHYIWAIYLIVYPFYLLPKGGPQIADVFGSIIIIVNFKTILTSINTNRYTKFLFLFVVYTFIVNTVWMLILGEIKVLKNSIFYLYGFFFMLAIFSKIKDKSFLEISLKAVSISLIIQTVAWPLIKSQGVRTQMFFNNPNQLALWATCLLVIIYVLTNILKTKSKYSIPLLVLCSLFILISASRAALGGALIFWAFYIIKSRKNLIIFGVVTVLAVILFGSSFDLDLKNFESLEYNMDRFSNNTISGSGNQSIGHRGFQRIGENPQYLVLGAGEGAFERFNEVMELHSIFASVLFCYGILGLFLYLSAYSSLFVNIKKETMALLFPLALFALVHMTLRIPLFWITLLFVIYLHEQKTQTDNFLSTD